MSDDNNGATAAGTEEATTIPPGLNERHPEKTSHDDDDSAPCGQTCALLAQTEIDGIEESDGYAMSKEYTSYTLLGTMQKAQRERIHAGKKMKKTVESFYDKQDAVIKSFEDTIDITESPIMPPTEERQSKWVNRAAKISFLANVLLLAAKAVAAYLSGSISVISSLVDSAIDLVSGFIIWYSGRAMRNSNIYKYPVGKQRLEPLSILVLSSIMAVCAAQIIIESINRIVEKSPVYMDIGSIAVMSGTVAVKIFLFLFCKRVKSPSTEALAQDHRNDVMSNCVALLCGAVATYYWLYADPLGAILMSIYIFYNWYQTGAVQIKKLAGKTAPPEFLQKITWICLHHDNRITEIDTVRAFHIGYNYIVEVDIVLPEQMTLKEAHNVGEPLQIKLEKLPGVERAFVHLDYEFEHNPNSEHKRL
ncbi:uncharacterized protein [Ptychodera flava]|uniref:uncharacterized protein n=1 Tax=Ptychodera flava TaxID=63121 RepID=UPI003969E0E2